MKTSVLESAASSGMPPREALSRARKLSISYILVLLIIVQIASANSSSVDAQTQLNDFEQEAIDSAERDDDAIDDLPSIPIAGAFWPRLFASASPDASPSSSDAHADDHPKSRHHRTMQPSKRQLKEMKQRNKARQAAQTTKTIDWKHIYNANAMKVACKYRKSCYITGKLPELHVDLTTSSSQPDKPDSSSDNDDVDPEDLASSRDLKLHCKYRTSCYVDQGIEMTEENEKKYRRTILAAKPSDSIDDLGTRQTLKDVAKLVYEKTKEDSANRPIAISVPKQLDIIEEKLRLKNECKYRKSCYATGEIAEQPQIDETPSFWRHWISTPESIAGVPFTEMSDSQMKHYCKYRKSCYETGELPDLDEEHPPVVEEPIATPSRPIPLTQRCKYRKSCYETGELPADLHDSSSKREEEKTELVPISVDGLKLHCKYRKSCYAEKAEEELSIAFIKEKLEKKNKTVTEKVKKKTKPANRAKNTKKVENDGEEKRGMKVEREEKSNARPVERVEKAESIEPAIVEQTTERTNMQEENIHERVESDVPAIDEEPTAIDDEIDEKRRKKKKKSEDKDETASKKPKKHHVEEKTTIEPEKLEQPPVRESIHEENRASEDEKKAEEKTETPTPEATITQERDQPRKPEKLEKKSHHRESEHSVRDTDEEIVRDSHREIEKPKKSKKHKQETTSESSVEDVARVDEKETVTVSASTTEKEEEPTEPMQVEESYLASWMRFLKGDDHAEEEKKRECQFRQSCYETGDRPHHRPPIDYSLGNTLHIISGLWTWPAREAQEEEEEEEQAKTLSYDKEKLNCKYRKSCYETGELPDLTPLVHADDEDDDDDDSKRDGRAWQLNCKYRKSCYDSGHLPEIEPGWFGTKTVPRKDEIDLTTEEDDDGDDNSWKLKCKYRKSCYETGKLNTKLLHITKTVIEENVKEKGQSIEMKCKYRKSCYHKEWTAREKQEAKVERLILPHLPPTERIKEYKKEQEKTKAEKAKTPAKEVDKKRKAKGKGREEDEEERYKQLHETKEERREQRRPSEKRPPTTTPPPSIAIDPTCNRWRLSCRTALGLPPMEKAPIGPNGKKLCRKKKRDERR